MEWHNVNFSSNSILEMKQVNNSNITVAVRRMPQIPIIPVGTWYSYAMIITSLAAILCGGTGMVIICKSKSLLQKDGNILVLALLGTHVCTALVTVATFAIEFHCDCSAHAYVTTLHQATLLFAMRFLYMYELGMVTLVTLERLVAVKFPFYHENCSRRLYIIAIVVNLIPPIGFILLRIAGHVMYAYLIFSFSVFCTILSICISYIILYKITKKHIKRLARLVVSDDKVAKKKKLQYLHRRKLKTAIIGISITATTILFLVPIEICSILILANGNLFWNKVTTQVQHIASLLVASNSVKDSLLNIFLNRDIREELKMMFKNRVRPNVTDEEVQRRTTKL